ncbi:tRNA (adenine(58)-N(1))-methyltransferase catalytic subunit TRMT61A [Atheta coriaria]|uniref:tRNA (adenine(58)-N(1))-methyltransferase catalytic subunit TRMT61A n=1 Tax=Dalotia coriaria TaxID=877792 RepID=UPI0031F45BD2
MSFNGFKSIIQEGDIVVLYVSFNQMHPIKAVKQITTKKGNLVDNIFQTPYGALHCAELIGKEFGSKINLSKGYVFVLQPTSELWTLMLPHRTQIIYTPDISMIVLQLELKPGSIVIESGTGSASLSHALIRTIKPTGHLYTFDFHEERTKTAQQEFEEHGYGDYVTVAHRDVCATGFGNGLDQKADAIFLDLPHPWKTIEYAVQCLKEGGRICSFSPCIEQVQKTCTHLTKFGFTEIETIEVLQTQLSVQSRNMTSLNFDFLKEEGSNNSMDYDKSKEKQNVRVVTAVSPTTQAGHTGFLTFATLIPSWSTQGDLDDSIN